MPSKNTVNYTLVSTRESSIIRDGPQSETVSQHPELQDPVLYSEGETRRVRSARKALSWTTIGAALKDILMTATSCYFFIFAGLVYRYRDQPADEPINIALLQAARYGPTLFPIIFAALVARCLRSLAAFKLEQGSTVLTIEYLLHSRTVFTALTTPLELKRWHVLAPITILLWALSPLGSQASLRILYTGSIYHHYAQNFTYLAFVSTFPNEGEGSASAEPLVPTNAAFISSLMSTNSSKTSHQDTYGNIRVPIYETLPGGEGWRTVPETDIVWSSLTGLPVLGIPASGVSNFTINTGYMTTPCKLEGQPYGDYMQSLNSSNVTGISGAWSGGNFAIEVNSTDQYSPTWFIFRSLALELEIDTNDHIPDNKILTVATCNISMNYVQVQIECYRSSCYSKAVQPSTIPATHDIFNQTAYLDTNNMTLPELTPLNGLGQADTKYMAYWKDFIGATSPSIGCDTSFCTTSLVEGFLANPASPFSASIDPLWMEDEDIFSQRFAQMVNGYWINSIAYQGIMGNFSLAKAATSKSNNGYNVDSFLGTVANEVIVMKCNMAWLFILLCCSVVLLLCGVAGVVLGMLRKGPDILDSFSGMLADSPFVHDPQHSSMEDAYEKARRLHNVRVRLGDVRSNRSLGRAAVATLDGSFPVEKLKKMGLKRAYE